ncbi:MAG TPA: zf-HC2 domain-containing protein [Streptosporangiaceae bacterium]|nr:zf-HC2 domain-containing protein [Streptosporangiaceae bacterium]
MTGPADCREVRHALGVYVLGAIEPAERAVVDSHLSTCQECREELAGLAGLPALLRRIPVGEAQQLADEPDGELADDMRSDRLLDSLLARTSRTRQTRRWRGLAAAAAVVVLAGAAGAATWSALNPPATAPVASTQFKSVTASDPVTHVSATVRYTAKDWGTALDTKVHGLPENVRCSLLVTDTAGRTVVAGSWTTSYDEGTTWYPGASSVPLDSVRSFQITSGGRVLITVPVH